MASNVNITPGTGDVVAAEDITSVKYQKIKLVDSTASSTTGTGIAANPLQVSLANTAANATAVKVDPSAVTSPVSLASVPSHAVTNAGTFAVQVSTINSVAPAFGTGVRGATVQRVTIATDDSVPVTGTFWQATQPISHVDVAPATQNITAADAVSATGTGANSQSIITGTPTANSAATFALTGQTSVIIQTTGTWVATLQVEVSMDGGTTWYTRGLHQAGTSYTAVSFTGNFAGGTSTAGYTNIRVRATAYTSGTATIRVTETLNPNSVYIANSLKLSDSTTPSQQLAIDSAGAISIQSAGATGSAVPSRGIYNAGNAATSLPSAATAGNLTGAMYDKFGRQIIISGGMRDIIGSQRTTITASTSETTIVTAAASTFNDLFLLTIRNTSATAVRVDIRDTTAGTIIDDIYVPAGDMRGWALPQGVAAQTTVNTNWTAQCSASVTDVRITAWFFKNK